MNVALDSDHHYAPPALSDQAPLRFRTPEEKTVLRDRGSRLNSPAPATISASYRV